MVVESEDGLVKRVEIIRGAPCDATWLAAERIIGLPVDEAADRFGLEIQMHCKADPSGWDPIHGKSPVHFAGKVHRAAYLRGVKADEAG